eukprot:7514069-Pyramimonas_sp.AAC.1
MEPETAARFISLSEMASVPSVSPATIASISGSTWAAMQTAVEHFQGDCGKCDIFYASSSSSSSSLARDGQGRPRRAPRAPRPLALPLLGAAPAKWQNDCRQTREGQNGPWRAPRAPRLLAPPQRDASPDQ